MVSFTVYIVLVNMILILTYRQCIMENNDNLCEKVTYDSFNEAMSRAQSSKKGRSYGKTGRRLATKKPKRAYKCPVCGKFHITSQKKKWSNK